MLRIHQNLLPTLFEQFVFFHNRKWLRIIKCNYFFKCKLPSFFSRCVRGYCTGIIFIKCRTHYVDQTLNLTNAIIVIWDNNVWNTGYRVLKVWMNSINELNQKYRNEINLFRKTENISIIISIIKRNFMTVHFWYLSKQNTF